MSLSCFGTRSSVSKSDGCYSNVKHTGFSVIKGGITKKEKAAHSDSSNEVKVWGLFIVYYTQRM